jgi:ubiquitin-protein ligase E3 C
MADIYTHSLLTMGDDEFFSSAANPAAPRNPLPLDEVASLARRLLNIAFTLYWRDDQTSVQEGGVQGLNIRWEAVREKVTKCLVAIHARESVLSILYLRQAGILHVTPCSSRKPFTPPGHWLVSSQFDMQSFVDAAVFVSTLI